MDKTNVESRIQEGLPRRWGLSGALKDRQGKVGERPIQVAAPRKKTGLYKSAARAQCEECEAAGLATRRPAFLQGCREGPVC